MNENQKDKLVNLVQDHQNYGLNLNDAINKAVDGLDNENEAKLFLAKRFAAGLPHIQLD